MNIKQSETIMMVHESPHAVVFSGRETETAEARIRASQAIVSAQLGIRTRKREITEAQASVEAYVSLVSGCADTYLTPIYENLRVSEDPDDDEATMIHNEYFIRRGTDRAADGVEADIKLLHADIISRKSEQSGFQRAFEHARAFKRAKMLGQLATNMPAAGFSYATTAIFSKALSSNSDIGEIVGQDNKIAFGAVIIGAFAVGRFTIPAVIKSATQTILGKKINKAMKPVSERIVHKLQRDEEILYEKAAEKYITEQQMIKKAEVTAEAEPVETDAVVDEAVADAKPEEIEIKINRRTKRKLRRENVRKLSHKEKVAEIRKLEVKYIVGELHEEMVSELGDWLIEVDTDGHSTPDRHEAVEIIRRTAVRHLFHEFGLGFAHIESDERNLLHSEGAAA